MMKRIWPIAVGVVTDSLRRKVVYVVLVFAALLALAIPSLPDYGLGVESAVFREVALALAYVTALVVTLSLAANRIPAEFERRTVYNVVAKGVSRWEYLVGTWLGVFSSWPERSLPSPSSSRSSGSSRTARSMWRLWQGALAIWLEMGVVAAFAVASRP